MEIELNQVDSDSINHTYMVMIQLKMLDINTQLSIPTGPVLCMLLHKDVPEDDAS